MSKVEARVLVLDHRDVGVSVREAQEITSRVLSQSRKSTYSILAANIELSAVFKSRRLDLG